MASSGGSGGTGGASSSQPSTLSMIGSLYIHQVPFQSTTNPTKVIKNMGFFSLKKMLELLHGMFHPLLT
jgi:hypothetical protein